MNHQKYKLSLIAKYHCFKEATSNVQCCSEDKTRKLSYGKDDRTMRPMYGCRENFRESLTTPTATFPEILMGFCSD